MYISPFGYEEYLILGNKVWISNSRKPDLDFAIVSELKLAAGDNFLHNIAGFLFHRITATGN